MYEFSFFRKPGKKYIEVGCHGNIGTEVYLMDAVYTAKVFEGYIVLERSKWKECF